MKFAFAVLTIFLVSLASTLANNEPNMVPVDATTTTTQLNNEEVEETKSGEEYLDHYTAGIKNVRVIGTDELNIFKTKNPSRPSNELKVVYFFSKTVKSTPDYILSAYDESGTYMEQRGHHIELVRFNCDTDKAPECSQKDVFSKMYIYKQGTELVSLSIDTMFDFASISSNLMELYCLEDVKIFRTKAEAEEVEPKCRAANQNGLISYLQSFGTYEHLHMLETVVKHLKKMKLAVTTTISAVRHLPDFNPGMDFQAWLLLCHNVPAHEPCKYIKYKLPMDETTFSNFVNTSFKPTVVHVSSEADFNKKMMDKSQAEVHILYTDTDSIDHLESIALNISHQYFGQIRVVIIDVKKVDLKLLGYDVTKEREYPSLTLIKLNDTKKNEMIHQFTEDNCMKFIRMVMFKIDTKGIDLDKLDDSVFHEGIDVVQMQDDEVTLGMMALGESKVLEFLNYWPKLTDKTFPDAMNENIHLVVFFVSWNQLSSALFHSMINTKSMYPNHIDSKHVSAVDCSHWPDICSKQNVTKYPTVHIYRKNKIFEYNGMLDGKTVFAAMKLCELPNPIMLKTQDEIESFIDGKNPNDLHVLWDEVVFGHLKMHSKEYDAFIGAAELLHGKTLFGLSSDETAKNKYCEKFGASYPCIVLLHRNEKRSFVVFDGKPTVEDLQRFVKRQCIPRFSELTVRNMPAIYRLGKPMVILFVDIVSRKAQMYSDIVSNIATSGKFDRFVFTWMNTHEVDSVGTRILQSYMEEIRVPAIAVLNKKINVVFTYEKPEITENGITEWLASIQDGKIEPKMLLKKREFKPLHPGYDVNELKLHNFGSDSDDNDFYGAIQNDEDENTYRGGGRLKGTGHSGANIPDTDDLEILKDQIKSEIHNLKDSGVMDDGSKKMADKYPHQEL